MNPKLQPILQVPSLRSRRKNPTKINNPQRNVDGDWVVHSASPKSKKEDQGKEQQQMLSPNAKQQAARPKTLNLNISKAKQQWEEEMERLNSKYNLDCYSDSGLDSESDEGEQYHYKHSYETLI